LRMLFGRSHIQTRSIAWPGLANRIILAELILIACFPS